jgi:hypothetical protein
MPSADEVIQRARQLAEIAFDELTSISGVTSSFAHDVLDAWYEREQHESTSAGVDYFRRQAAFQLLLGLTCLPGTTPPVQPPEVDVEKPPAEEVDATSVDTEPLDTEPVTDADATPAVGIPRKQDQDEDKLSRRERRRRG